MRYDCSCLVGTSVSLPLEALNIRTCGAQCISVDRMDHQDVKCVRVNVRSPNKA